MTDRRAIAAGLFAFGGIIVLGTEVFFIQDVFQSRMNTLFKAYYQVWTLWGVAAAIVLVDLLDRQVAPRRQALAGLAMAGAVMLGIIYPVTSAVRWAEVDGSAAWQGLDGAAYVADWSVDEYDAIAWLRANAGPEDVVIEAPGCSYQPVSMVPTSRASACEIATPLPQPPADWLAANGWTVAFQQGDVTIWSRS